MTTAEQLGEWEAAWAGLAEGAGFFKPSLLEDETIGVLAGYEGDRIVAGAIANRSSTVIGLTPANRSGSDARDASRDVARVVSDVSVLCPRLDVFLGNMFFSAPNGRGSQLTVR